MKVDALAELTQAESLMNNWKYLPGSQVKMMVTHLVKALDAVASYVLDQEVILERVYLTLSQVKLFDDNKVEDSFYNTYFFLKGLLNKQVERVNEEVVRIITPKQVINADHEYFESLINDVKTVVDEAFKG